MRRGAVVIRLLKPALSAAKDVPVMLVVATRYGPNGGRVAATSMRVERMQHPAVVAPLRVVLVPPSS